MSYGGKIALLPGQSSVEEFSTLVHELAHEMLHKAERRTATTKTVRETEAEAVAFVIGKTIGLETGRASADYNHTSRPLIARHHKLPWIPNDDDWQSILAVARNESIRNRVMLAFAYDAGLRREELCSLRSDDIDPSRRTLRIRAETTKGRRERIVPYSTSSGELLHGYLQHRRTLGQKRGPLFLSESRRNYTEPISIWSWSKVIRGVARRAQVDRFSTHTLRHLCLTDLARAGWDIHKIAAFAGHRSIQTTLLYIHLSGRDLSAKLAAGMAQIHARRAQMLAEVSR
jgi:integrase/recombinase XerD